MFKLYNNHHEAELLLNAVKPLFKYSKYSETCYSLFNDYIAKKYTANCEDGWDVSVTFRAKKKDGSTKKVFHPKLTFRKVPKPIGNQYSKSGIDNDVHNCYLQKLEESQNLAIFERIEKSRQISDLLQITYNPDFNRMLNIIDIFIEQGLDSGIFANVERKKYEKHMRSHIHVDHYFQQVSLWHKNHSTVLFDNTLQKSTGKKKQHFKKSFISVDVEYLVNSLGEVNPYFKLKLPITAHLKETYFMSLVDEPKLYLVINDESLESTPIDKILSIPLSDVKITEYFKEKFNEYIKNTISQLLNIKKDELDVMSSSQLKEYFVIVSMIRL